jgi:hypothetical protein
MSKIKADLDSKPRSRRKALALIGLIAILGSSLSVTVAQADPRPGFPGNKPWGPSYDEVLANRAHHVLTATVVARPTPPSPPGPRMSRVAVPAIHR